MQNNSRWNGLLGAAWPLPQLDGSDPATWNGFSASSAAPGPGSGTALPGIDSLAPGMDWRAQQNEYPGVRIGTGVRPAPDLGSTRLANALDTAAHLRDAERAFVAGMMGFTAKDALNAASQIGGVDDMLGIAGNAARGGAEIVRGYHNVRSGMPLDDAIANGLGRLATDKLAGYVGEGGGGLLAGAFTDNPVAAAIGGILGDGLGSYMSDRTGLTDAGGNAAANAWRSYKKNLNRNPGMVQAWSQMLYQQP